MCVCPKQQIILYFLTLYFIVRPLELLHYFDEDDADDDVVLSALIYLLSGFLRLSLTLDFLYCCFFFYSLFLLFYKFVIVCACRFFINNKNANSPGVEQRWVGWGIYT